MMTRVALVTGGTRGIGAAIAKALKGAGHQVAATFAGNREKAEAFRTETGIATYQWDVSEERGCSEGVKRIESEVGPVDILVNNAGITRDGWFHKSDYDAWSAVIRTNLDSMFTMTRPVIEGMRSRKFGRVVNIASINGQKGQLGQVNYSTAKAGMIGFTKALALENARNGITVNCVCPGYIDTDMVAAVPEKALEGIIAAIPVGRLGKADEIASLVVYLASDQSAFMTGAVLSINGGQYMANG
jgi:acetoacetyl-CoA reductase